MAMLSAPFRFLSVPEGQTISDRWFAALDQRIIQVGAERWRAHVLGIHDEGGELWIQIVQAHETTRSIVIRCWHMQRVEEVIAALRATHVGSGESMQIVNTFRLV